MKQVWLVSAGLVFLAVIILIGYSFRRSRVAVVDKTATESPLPTASPNLISATGSAQIVQDSAGLYSIEIPEDWQIAPDEVREQRISSLLAQSPDYKVEIDATSAGSITPIRHQFGASLQVIAFQPALATNPQPDGKISEQKPILLDGTSGTYFVFTESNIIGGQLLEVRCEKSGRTYVLRFSFNPATFSAGSSVFDQMLSSFRWQ